MAFQTKSDLNTETTIKLGGTDERGKANPTSVEGYYLGHRVTKDTGYGPGTLHIFQTEKGNVGVWGKTRMNTLLTSDLVGQMTRVTFTGMGQKVKGKNPAYLYRVEHDAENTLSVADLENAVSSAQSQEDDNYADDTDLDADDVQEEQSPPPTRATAPSRPAQAPDAARAAKVQELLNRGRSKTSV